MPKYAPKTLFVSVPLLLSPRTRLAGARSGIDGAAGNRCPRRGEVSYRWLPGAFFFLFIVIVCRLSRAGLSLVVFFFGALELLHRRTDVLRTPHFF